MGKAQVTQVVWQSERLRGCELVRAAKEGQLAGKMPRLRRVTATSATIGVGDCVGNSAGAWSGARKVPRRVLMAQGGRAPSGSCRKNQTPTRGVSDGGRTSGSAGTRSPEAKC